MLFVEVSSEGSKGIEPFLGCSSLVKFSFLSFRCFSNLRFKFGVVDRNKVPRLFVCAGRCGSCRENRVFDNFLINRVGGEMPD